MNIFEIEVHPAAEAYAMIPADELQVLADSIVRNGLRDPIMIDMSSGDPVLIDGRNRLAACKLVGIESDEIDYIEFDHGDIEEYVIDKNGSRRHLSKGQRAMGVAIMRPNGAKAGRGKLSTEKGQFSKYERNQISRARTVLRVRPLDAVLVREGELSLSEAYAVAKIELAKGNTSSEQMEWLEENHPELATMVREETLTQTAAMVEARQRDSNAEANRYASAQVVKGFLSGIDGIIGSANSKHTLEKLIGHQDEFEKNVGMSKTDIQSKISELRSGIESIENYIGGIE